MQESGGTGTRPGDPGQVKQVLFGDTPGMLGKFKGSIHKLFPHRDVDLANRPVAHLQKKGRGFYSYPGVTYQTAGCPGWGAAAVVGMVRLKPVAVLRRWRCFPDRRGAPGPLPGARLREGGACCCCCLRHWGRCCSECCSPWGARDSGSPYQRQKTGGQRRGVGRAGGPMRALQGPHLGTESCVRTNIGYVVEE